MTDPISTLFADGYKALALGKEQDALHGFTQALARSRETSNEPLLAEALTALGYAERTLKSITNSLGYYNAAAEAYRRLGEPLRLAHTVRHVADILRENGRVEEPNREYEEALAAYRASQKVPPLDLANALRGFALLKESLAEATIARAVSVEAGNLYEAAGVQAGADESHLRISSSMSKAIMDA